jgi:16S rRNA (cytidine1402-2'-O)-methyltransferase
VREERRELVTFNKGKLYIVATPIGNLDDLTYRAVQVLKSADLVAAEDTRHTRSLLARYGIQARLVSVHEHNEHRLRNRLVRVLNEGESVALVSDAGTPLISDPGFELVNAASDNGIEVIPVPGPSAVICALSVSGLATDRFGFYGFLPRNRSSRKTFLESLLCELGTLVFYESCHRIVDCLESFAGIFPAGRKLVIAREMTKRHETIVRTVVGDALERVMEDPNMRKGEFVLLLEGETRKRRPDQLSSEQIDILELLLEECSVKKSSEIVSMITGMRHKLVYSTALEISRRRS